MYTDCVKVQKNTVNFYHVNRKSVAEEYCKFLSCKQEKCSVRIRSMVKLYMKVRIHHALKMSNMNNSENKSGKHNRKMLKLSHF